MNVNTLAISALVELAALGKEDWESALQQILKIDAGVLNVERVSYWSFHAQPPGIFCELGFQTGARLYERGARLAVVECPNYFQEIRRGDVVAVDNVQDDERLRGMEGYMSARGVKSLMDVPIWVRSDLAGILCHEHTSQREWVESEVEFALAVSHSLSATLEARQRCGAEAAGRRSAFLAEVSSRLAESLDLHGVAQRAVDLALPRLADWAVLDILEKDKIRRLATAHKDPNAHAILKDASKRFPPAINRPHLTALVMRLGQSILHPTVADTHLSRYTVNNEHLEMIRALGARSAIGVPLSAKHKVFGALALFSSERTYRHDDLQLAEDFALRVSCAFVNARLYQQAKDAIAIRDDFLSLAAHELRTPLAGVQLGIDVLSQRFSGADLRNSPPFQVLVRQVDRLRRFAEELLDASQIGASQLSIRPVRVDLAALVRELSQEFDYQLTQAGCAVTTNVAGPVVGYWDSVQLERLLCNLLDNVIKFAAGHPVEISVSARGDEATLVVQDHGMGIQPERLKDVYGRYERCVPMKNFGGLGLGLYIVRAIVDAHGGTVRIESHLNQGTRVTVELPRFRSCSAEQAESEGFPERASPADAYPAS